MLIIRIDIVLCGFVNEATLDKALANVTNEICFHKFIKICISLCELEEMCELDEFLLKNADI